MDDGPCELIIYYNFSIFLKLILGIALNTALLPVLHVSTAELENKQCDIKAVPHRLCHSQPQFMHGPKPHRPYRLAKHAVIVPNFCRRCCTGAQFVRYRFVLAPVISIY